MKIFKILTRKFFLFSIFIINLIVLNIQCASKNVETNLRISSEKINKMCPITIDSKTILLSTTVPCEKCFRYLYQFDFDLNTLNIEEFISSKKLFLINSLRTSESMKYFRDNHIIVEYHYVNLSGINLAKIELLPEEYQ